MTDRTVSEESHLEAAEALWRRFLGEGCTDSRNGLVEHYLPLARKIAARMYQRRVNVGLSLDDFLQPAYSGLIEAVDRFDPKGGASFETFAGYRIRGGVLNSIEKLSESHSFYAQQSRRERDRVKSLTGNVDEREEAGRFEQIASAIVHLALGEMLADDFPSDPVMDPRMPANSVYASTEAKQITRRLRQEVGALEGRERKIIEYHYFHGVAFAEIAEIFGLTKGRVSQLHKKALNDLEGRLRGPVDLDSFC